MTSIMGTYHLYIYLAFSGNVWHFVFVLYSYNFHIVNKILYKEYMHLEIVVFQKKQYNP